jgi:hypothetical protein
MVGARTCAYCGSDGPLTREHLWPQALHRRLPAVEDNAGFWLAKIGKEIQNEPTVRDVCATCNNGALSKLDAYICYLFDTYFIHSLERHDQVIFEFNYHLLKRWLVKMCFNSARVNASIDQKIAFPPLLPYILGKSETIGRSVQLYVQLSYPGRIPDDLLSPADPRPMIYHPVIHRVGHIWFTPRGIGKKLLRAVHLRSYTFYLAFWEQTEKRKEIEFFTDVFLERMCATKLLRVSVNTVELVCDGFNAWDSFYRSREGKFVAS